MYISTSDFSKRTINKYIKLKIRVVFRELLVVKCLFNVFSKQIKYWKLVLKTVFSVHNIHYYLYGHVEITKWIFWSKKIGVKSACWLFLMHKGYFHIKFGRFWCVTWYQLNYLDFNILLCSKSCAKFYRNFNLDTNYLEI